MIRVLVVAFFALIPHLAYCATMNAVQSGITQDLNASLSELSSLRERIAAEKIPTSKKISALEIAIVKLRKQLVKEQSIQDSKFISLDELKLNVENIRNRNRFIRTNFNDYAKKHIALQHISEKGNLKIKPANTSELISLADGTMLLGMGIKRLFSGVEKVLYPGTSIDNHGNLLDGNFLRLGDNYWFISETFRTSGIVTSTSSGYPFLLEGNGKNDFISKTHTLIELPVDFTQGRAIKVANNSSSLADHIQQGGLWVMPILFFAFMSLLISGLKLFQYYKTYRIENDNIAMSLKLWKNSHKKEALLKLNASNNPLNKIIMKGMVSSFKDKNEMEDALGNMILDSKPGLEKLLPLISITASISPLLGLLGTISGIIQTFKMIAIFGSNDTQTLSGGISEALITTELGLIVAIPALILHVFLKRKSQSIIAQMEKYTQSLVNIKMAEHGNATHG